MRLSILFILVLCLGSLEAQFIQEKNLQLLLFGTKGQYGVVPADSNGIVMYNEIPNTESVSTRRWQIVYLNSNLEPQQRSYFESDYNFRLTHVRYYKGFVYLLFQDLNIPMRSVFFARADISDDQFEFFEIKEFLPKAIVGFEILGNSLFLIGLDNDRPTILKFKYGDLRPQVLQGLYNNNNDLLHVSILPGGDLLQIVTRLKKRQGKRSVILVKQFNENGEIFRDILIESSKGYHLIDGIANTDNDGRLCVVGTFSYNKTTTSDGIFTVVFDKNGAHPLYYYDYTNLHNYFTFLPEKEQQRLRKKYKMDEGGDKKSKYKENQAMRELVKTGDSWTYIGEIIKVKERNSRIYGNIWPMEYRQFSHAIILGIGNDGRLKWDNSFGMEEFISNSQLQQVRMSSFKDQTYLYYQNGPYINYKIIDENRNIREGIYEIDIPDVDFTRVEIQNYGNVLPWYDNSFIIFGSYSISPKLGDGKRFFYLTKLSIASDYNVNNP